ncbi:uncharacterized protein [Coffea arabica]|uniref:Uncharacterized protein n=1 Tax=Coffea arabica TaxID=13443 RepID=A0A6P6VEG8_COFAR|nr:uncharacterized protein LOC113720267 [Coffea arabica]XP_027119777.1 uncharacterized protein LOC113736813 [Coffea arabica]
MRRSFSKFSYPSTTTRPSFISSSSTSPFSTSSGAVGGGGGRGRGRGSISPKFQFTKEDHTPKPSENSSVAGFGHGQGGGRGGGSGKPLPSSLPPFTSFVDKTAVPVPGRGQGRGRGIGAGLGAGHVTPPTPAPAQPSDPSRKPIFSSKDGGVAPHDSHLPPPTQSPTVPRNPEDTHLPSSILTILSGAGRGKAPRSPSPVPDKPIEENRHIRARQQPPGATREDSSTNSAATSAQRLSPEEAAKKAVGILSGGRGDAGRDEGARGGRGGGGFRGRGGRGGRGLQAWRGRGGGGPGGQGDRGARFEDAGFEDTGYEDTDDDDSAAGLYLGDDADGDKLTQRLGPDIMDQLSEGFEEMSSRVLPSPEDDAYLDALHTNLLIECEPEYIMGNFDINPDIDEKPPIPLRDALEKMKPFLMAYEGIQSQQEWEEAVEETMKKVPLLKEIVDYYSGPDRVTAKQQQEEIERVAKALPESVPASVKRFTNRAVLSLQSNPGWGFDKKCQFMDKLVSEISQHYK